MMPIDNMTIQIVYGGMKIHEYGISEYRYAYDIDFYTPTRDQIRYSYIY